MADISLRFHKDMLVLSTPLKAALARQGVDVDEDFAMTLLLEEDSLADVMRVESAAMAQCLVVPSDTLLPARLLHANMQDQLDRLASIAIGLAEKRRPQHLLVELGPTGLPLDPSSKGSLVEVRDQYVRAAHAFEKHTFDAYFLNGFSSVDELKCALMGLRKASDRPVFASVDVDAQGSLPHAALEDAIAVMEEYGAAVAGVQTKAAPKDAVAVAQRMAQATQLPLLVQLQVVPRTVRHAVPTAENPYPKADTMFDAALALRAAGVQFLRATGAATPAYTGALAASVLGADVAPARFNLGD